MLLPSSFLAQNWICQIVHWCVDPDHISKLRSYKTQLHNLQFGCVLKVEYIKGNMHTLNRCDVDIVLAKIKECGRRNPFDEKFPGSKVLGKKYWPSLLLPYLTSFLSLNSAITKLYHERHF